MEIEFEHEFRVSCPEDEAREVLQDEYESEILDQVYCEGEDPKLLSFEITHIEFDWESEEESEDA